MREQLKTIGFAAAVCLVCSLLLAVVYSSLKEQQERNKANELKVKVLSVFGVEVTNEKGKVIMPQEEIDSIFADQISGKVLDSSGTLLKDVDVADLSSADINDRDKETKLKKFYPLYVYTDKETGEETIAIHLSGMGLWSIVKAYMAMEKDLVTIGAIVFYEHAETPGLGGEIEKDFFLQRFKGKKMCTPDKSRAFDIIKAGQQEDDVCISGISGATMTCNGVAKFIRADYEVYSRYFETIRK